MTVKNAIARGWQRFVKTIFLLSGRDKALVSSVIQTQIYWLTLSSSECFGLKMSFTNTKMYMHWVSSTVETDQLQLLYDAYFYSESGKPSDV